MDKITLKEIINGLILMVTVGCYFMSDCTIGITHKEYELLSILFGIIFLIRVRKNYRLFDKD